MSRSNTRPPGIWMAAALVVGNMIGSAVLLPPSSLTPFGAAGLLVTGALLLAGLPLYGVTRRRHTRK